MSRTEISAARDLIAGMQKENPRLYNALLLMAESIEGMQDILEPLIRRSAAAAVSDIVPDTPTGFTSALYSQYVELEWNPAANATEYELREGTDWNTADFIERTTAHRSVLEPLLIGTHTFLLKALNAVGDYSADLATTVVYIPAITAVTLTSQVIDNNVLLYWTIPASTFTIDRYDLYRNNVKFGESRSTFHTIFETTAGNYTYKVVPVDIAGNEGNPASVIVYVNQPPDFELQALRTSALGGTKTSVLLRDGRLLCNIATQSWQAHFTSRAWLTPRNQWDAGFHLYIEPTSNSGSYLETFDFGGVFNSVIINIDWSYRNIGADPISVGCQIEGSTDNLNWSAPTSGKTAFFQSVRYIRMTLTFTGTNNHSLAEVWNIRVAMDVKKEVDSGVVSALAADANGTAVNFNKAFKDIDSITVAPLSNKEPLEAIYNFTDVPNPTGFTVFAFDTAGNRVNATVSWKARGIV